MDFQTLKYFSESIQQGSIAKAARKCFISQSALSMALQKLEKEVGGKLLERHSHGIIPTPLGLQFHKICLEILEKNTEILNLIKNSSQKISGSISIAAIYSLGLFSLNQFSTHFLKKYPDIQLQIHYQSNGECLKMLQKGEVDIALMAEQPLSPRLNAISCGKDEMVIIFSHNSPLAQQNPFSVQNLIKIQTSYIGFNKEQPTQKWMDDLFSKYQVPIKPKMRFDNVELVKRSVQAQLGFAIVPKSTVMQELADQKLSCCSILEKGFFRNTLAVFKKDKNTSRPLRILLTELKKNLLN